MNSKLSDEAFAYYAGLGPKRSYAAVAERFGVGKRTVVNAAKRQDWQGRLVEAETKARAKTDERIVETLEELNARHLKVGKFVLSKGLEALRSMAITKPADALRAVAQGVEQERAVLVPTGARASGSDRNAEFADARQKAAMIREFLKAADATIPPPPVSEPPT